MQVLERSIRLSGTEQEDLLIGVNIGNRTMVVLENRGPGTVDIVDVGELPPNRFVLIGPIGAIKVQPPSQFAVIDVKVFMV